MKRKIFLVCGLLFSILLMGRTAKGQADVLWPPDPTKLFTDAVTVLKTQLSTHEIIDQPAVTKCGTIWGVKESSGWSIKKDSDHYYLCELATGKRYRRLYDDYDWKVLSDDGYAIGSNPDGTWVVFSGEMVGRQEDEQFSVVWFSYNVNTDTLIALGNAYYLNDLQSFDFGGFEWVTNTEFVMSFRDQPEWSLSYAYVADVRHTNSLILALTNQRYIVAYESNPPRLEKFVDPSNDESMDRKHVNCTRSIYYLKTHIMVSYSYGKLCNTEYGPVDGTGYYRNVVSRDVAALVRFNPITQEQVELYRGELESVYWVSPDEHYAVLGMDDNGRIDCVPGFEHAPEAPEFGCMGLGHPTFDLIDLKTKTLLYKEDGPGYGSGPGIRYSQDYPDSDVIQQLDKTHLLLQNHDEDPHPYKLLTLVSGEVDVLPIDGYIVSVTDDKRLLRYLGNNDNWLPLDLYTPETKQTVLLVNRTDNYSAVVDSVKGSILTVSVSPKNDNLSDFPYHTRIAQYTLLLATK